MDRDSQILFTQRIIWGAMILTQLIYLGGSNLLPTRPLTSEGHISPTTFFYLAAGSWILGAVFSFRLVSKNHWIALVGALAFFECVGLFGFVSSFIQRGGPAVLWPFTAAAILGMLTAFPKSPSAKPVVLSS